jgi:hypothetical protein
VANEIQAILHLRLPNLIEGCRSAKYFASDSCDCAANRMTNARAARTDDGKANEIQGILIKSVEIQKIWDEIQKILIELVKMQNILI